MCPRLYFRGPPGPGDDLYAPPNPTEASSSAASEVCDVPAELRVPCSTLCTLFTDEWDESTDSIFRWLQTRPAEVRKDMLFSLVLSQQRKGSKRIGRLTLRGLKICHNHLWYVGWSKWAVSLTCPPHVVPTTVSPPGTGGKSPSGSVPLWTRGLSLDLVAQGGRRAPEVASFVTRRRWHLWVLLGESH
jgi:hypothetical protein